MSNIVTSTDPKRDHAQSIFTAAYNSLGLTEDQAQRINLRGDEMKSGLIALFRSLAAEGRVYRIEDKIAQLIANGQHEAAGITAEAYRALWPETVEQPPEYIGRLDLPLLVDLTLDAERLAACNRNLVFWVQPGACEDMVLPPTHPETGKPLTRYVAWVQLGRWLNHNVEQARAAMPKDEVGLVSAEGMHLPGQCEKHLRKYAVDCCASRYGGGRAPCVYWFDDGRPGFNAHGVRVRYPGYGSGSRGKRVIPVTWMP